MARSWSRTSELVKTVLDNTPIQDSYLITLWANAMAGPASKQAERDYDVQRDEFNVMFVVAAIGPCLATDVCLLNSRPRNSISRAVRRLEKRGALIREAVEDDRRKARLSLTEIGRGLYESVLPLYIDRQNLLMDALNDDERRTLNRLLAKSLLSTSEWSTTF